MKEYHKINTIYKRDMKNKGKLIVGDWSTPEFEYLKDNDWEFTEKVDGTNIRVSLRVEQDGFMFVEYGGRTDKAQIPVPLLEALEEMFPTQPMYRRSLDRPGFFERHKAVAAWMLDRGLTEAVLYGEGYGPKIQDGEKYASMPSFVLFDVQVGDFWLESDAVTDVAEALDIARVPVVGYGTLSDAVALVTGDTRRRVEQRDETGEYHKAFVQPTFWSTWGDFEAEGIVARPVVQMFDRKGQRIIAKIKVRDFR